jgi:hypothetical protein
MKNYILLIFVALFYSCTDQGEVKKYDYTIINNSGVTVDIIPYDEENDINIQNKRTLLDGEKINKKLDVYPPYNDNLSLSGVLWGDLIYSRVPKAEIVFNNNKKVIYLNCTFSDLGITDCLEPRSIFNPINNSGVIQVYTITPEDYENAIPCDGDCN